MRFYWLRRALSSRASMFAVSPPDRFTKTAAIRRISSETAGLRAGSFLSFTSAVKRALASAEQPCSGVARMDSSNDVTRFSISWARVWIINLASSCGIWWSRESAFNRPAVIESPPQRANTEAAASTPITSTQRDAVERNQVCSRGVAALFSTSGPFAIARIIPLVVVDAFKCESWRAVSHVCDETLVNKPAFADGNASTAISLIHPICGRQTTTQHGQPDAVFRRSFLSATCTVANIGITFSTSTAFRMAADKAAALDQCFVSADALTAPNDSMMSTTIRGGYYGQLMKHLAGQVPECIAPSGYSVFSHAVSYLQGAVSVRGWGSLSTILSSASFYPIREAVA